MTPSKRDILAKSEAWHRLNARSPKEWSSDVIDLKHDVVTALQTILVAIQDGQNLTEVAYEMIEDRDKKYEQLYKDLFHPIDGAFAIGKQYVDSRLNALRTLGWSVLASTIAVTITIIVQLATN